MPAVCGHLAWRISFCPCLTLLFLLRICFFLYLTGWGAVAYSGGAEKDSRGAHEAGAGPSEAAEGGAENHPRQGQVQAQALLLPQSHRMRLLPLRPHVTPCLHPHPALPPHHSTPLLLCGTLASFWKCWKMAEETGATRCVNLLVPVKAHVVPPGLEDEAALRPWRTWLLPPFFLIPTAQMTLVCAFFFFFLVLFQFLGNLNFWCRML